MTKIHRLPDPETIEREASQWLARLNADDVSADDRRCFEAWRGEHPLHARAYDGLSATWRAYTAAGSFVRAVSFGQSMNEVVKARPSRRRWWFAAAAAVAVIASALGWFMVHRGPGTTFDTAIGEHASVALPDGSTLELNSNSLARVDYSDRARVIHLERGEAFFKVAHDSSRPFWVVGNGSWVRAVGTAFNVDLRPAGVRVTVSEGTVKVAAAEGADNRPPSDEALALAPVSVVTAGQEVDLHGSAAAVHTLRVADLTRTEAWRSGSVYFEKQPLSEVVEELGRYTNLRLSVDDARLRQLPVGGMFRANPDGVESFLTMLKDGFGLNVRREDGNVHIEGGVATSVK